MCMDSIQGSFSCWPDQSAVALNTYKCARTTHIKLTQRSMAHIIGYPSEHFHNSLSIAPTPIEQMVSFNAIKRALKRQGLLSAGVASQGTVPC